MWGSIQPSAPLLAIITGTSVGIGRAVAKAFAAAGASTACVARRSADLKTLVDEIISAGGKAIAVPADVAAKGAAQQIVSKVEAELGPIDILINNAAIARIGTLDAEDEDLDIWWRVFEVNVRAPVALIRAVLPSMLQRKTDYIITVSSGAATLALPAETSYASSKAAISKFHESLALELDGTGVIGLSINPGFIKTELGSPADAINKASAEHPAVKALWATVADGALIPQTVAVPADTLVALTADPRCKVLDGLYIDAAKRLDVLLEEAEKEKRGRIDPEQLYRIRIREL